MCDSQRDLVPFAQFKNTGKTPIEECYFCEVTGLKPATLLKVTYLHGYFSRFLNCANDTKLRSALQRYIFSSNNSDIQDYIKEKENKSQYLLIKFGSHGKISVWTLISFEFWYSGKNRQHFAYQGIPII